MGRQFSDLETKARNWMNSEGIPSEAQVVERSVSFRYQNQGVELHVPWTDSGDLQADLMTAIERFHQHHLGLYTFDQRDAQVELAGLMVSASGTLVKAAPAKADRDTEVSPDPAAHQKVYYQGTWLECPVYDRVTLPNGHCISGPAIITQLDATTYVLPGQSAAITGSGAIVVSEE